MVCSLYRQYDPDILGFLESEITERLLHRGRNEAELIMKNVKSLSSIEADKPLPDKYRFLLFDDKREVELVWNGKTNEVCNIVLPFQVIEQVDEPRAEKPKDTMAQTFLFDERGRQKTGWTNKLIWGDNKLILSSLRTVL